MIYFCCDERRRDAITLHPTLNGIDFLEVVDSDAELPEDRQRLLKVALIKPLGAVTIGLNNVLIAGGERIRNIKPISITTDPASNEVEIRVDRWGDFSRYVLRLVEISGADVDPLPGFVALLSAIEFSFKVECPSEFDCLDREPCPPELRPAPEIDYLTKDYQGFRRLMLDRITTLIPDWTERHAADFGVSLVELLAYTADYLSYQQDAIATESYLGTARRRVSIRRHARLVDYRIDEGAAARVWVQVRVKAGQGPVVVPKSPTLIESCPVPGTPPVNAPIRFLTRAPSIADPPKVIAPDSPEFAQAIANRVEVFELGEPEERTLFEDQNEMPFYTWGDRNCCLPKGATRATLDGDRTSLAKGDVIVLAEKAGPQTNLPADANPAHRHAVRLTDVALTDDPLFDLFDGGGLVQPHPVTNIAWDPADALPFPLCLSAQIGDDIATDLAVAYGNIVLADHGMTLLEAEELPEVPASTLSRVLAGGHDRCRDETEDEQRRSYVPPRYQPVLDRSPLTWTTRVRLQTKAGGTISDDYAPYDGTKPVATLVTGETVALPAVALSGKDDAHGWTARPDLLASDANSEDIVVEMESDGRALIRFGDDEYGKRPNPTSAFYAHYRIGNGIRGNIGPDAITQIVTTLIGIDSATNPLPAWGGRRPETFDEIRQRAPVAFRTPQRAITAEDYAMVVERHPGVQRAVATIQWTGSWRTIFITVDRVGGLEVDQDFEDDLRAFLERYRMAGHDVEIQPPVLVPLEIGVTVCVAPDHFRSDVKAALLEVFSNRVFPDGRRGAFHPDELTFGQSIYLSRFYAAAQAVDGVTSVEITVFRRLGVPASSALDTGELKLGRTEIASLENSANFPDRGVLRITLGGGK